MASNPRVAAGKGRPFSSSPVLATTLPAWRSRLVLFVLFAAFAALGVRAVWLQLFTEDFLQKQGASRYARTLVVPATRGRIQDRNGDVLALSLPVKAVWAIPDEARAAAPDKLDALARLLEIERGELDTKLRSPRGFVYLRRQVEQDTVDQVLALGIDGIETRKEYKRYYPQGSLTAHLVGFNNVEDLGQEGMELAHEDNLAGATGRRRVIKDRLGRVVEDAGTTRPARDGSNLVLSIDRNIQHIAHSHLKAAVERHQAKAGAVVVLDVRSGEVLALANLPDFDPNDRRGLTGAQLRNRVLTDTYEPGSVIKPFTIALALENGLVTPDTLVETAPGTLTIHRATIRDAKKHGTLTVSEVLQKSSNVGTAKLALQMPAEDMWTLLTKVGFGQPPQLGFPGTAAGRLRPHAKWKPIEHATISYGHGMSTSLLQMAQSYLVFARDGDMIPVSLLKTDEAPPARPVLSPRTAAAVRAMMEQATWPGGTAPRARVPGYRVAGKTSTAHKPVDGRYTNRYIAGFVGFAPVSAPRVIVALMIDEPSEGGYFGGLVAAPVFAAVTQDTLRALDVAPDAPVTDIISVVEETPEAM
ncbi:peptidoglycan D,D-transpeptidase FtsI family protein [Massilia sp. GCM10023247]|uniref:peptidoglycan D,D-transpeptidase FtsI family protein n=1 Tax=Massilia sp. GCM10023247 TaxID=3252643 RepID=UPI003623DC2E